MENPIKTIVKKLTKTDLAQLSRNERRAEAKKTGEPLVRGIQRSSDSTHKQIFVKEIRKSRAGVKYTVYKPLIVKK